MPCTPTEKRRRGGERGDTHLVFALCPEKICRVFEVALDKVIIRGGVAFYEGTEMDGYPRVE